MVQFGYKLMAEEHGPNDLVRYAQRAEQVGFDFVEMSDHFHPWLDSQGHSSFTWSVLASVASTTQRIGIATGVTCPIIRYHPAIVAQAAATLALLSGDRFTLALGAGERLNEHVVGLGWPHVAQRHQMLREAIDIIRLLWSGGMHSYEGAYLSLEDARVWDLPAEPPPLVVAISGPASARVAGELGDGIFTTEPDPELIELFTRAGGSGPRYSEAPLCIADDERTALQIAYDRFRFGLPGWKVMAELPNPVNFEAATSFARPEDMASSASCGPDPARHVEFIRSFVDAGYDHVAIVGIGPDQERFFDFYERELAPRLQFLR